MWSGWCTAEEGVVDAKEGIETNKLRPPYAAVLHAKGSLPTPLPQNEHDGPV